MIRGIMLPNKATVPALPGARGVRDRRMKTGATVAAGIRRRIAIGDLAVGEHLPPEEELTETFGIARPTLREAFRILESQGLISIRRGRGGGATVTMPDLEQLAEPFAVLLQLRHTTVHDLAQARSLMEPQLAARLALSHTDDDVALLRAAVGRASSAVDAHDGTAFGSAAAEFHQALIERGGNTTLSVIAELLRRLVVGRYVDAALQVDQALMRRAVSSYTKLVDLIERGDARGALEHWSVQMSWVIDAADDRPLDFYVSVDDGGPVSPGAVRSAAATGTSPR
jgi:GntR family transcriptional regulator, transcriptional repressor for pyruvate dehydrogenase complex